MSVCWRIIIVYALFGYDVYVSIIYLYLPSTPTPFENEKSAYLLYLNMLYYIVGTRWVYRYTVECRLRDSLMMEHIVMSPICIRLNVDSLNVWHILLYLIQITIYLRYSISFVRISVRYLFTSTYTPYTIFSFFLMCPEIEFNENVLPLSVQSSAIFVNWLIVQGNPSHGCSGTPRKAKSHRRSVREKPWIWQRKYLTETKTTAKK